MTRQGDRVVSLGGRKIDHEWEFDELDRHLDGNAVDVGVRRDGNELPRVPLGVKPAAPVGSSLRDRERTISAAPITESMPYTSMKKSARDLF